MKKSIIVDNFSRRSNVGEYISRRVDKPKKPKVFNVPAKYYKTKAFPRSRFPDWLPW